MSRGEREERKKKKGRESSRSLSRVFKTRIYILLKFLKQDFVFTQIDSCFQFLGKTAQFKLLSFNFELTS